MIIGKKGITISTLIEVGIIVLISIFTIMVIVATMDVDYGIEPSTTPIGFSNDTTSRFVNLTSAGKTGIESGGVTTSSFFGFNWDKAWTMLQTGALISWDVVSGNWISEILTNLFFGFPGIIYIAWLLRILLYIGILMAIVALVTKVRKP